MESHNDDHTHHHHSHADSGAQSWIGADGRVYHSHNGLAPHSHELIYSPGFFNRRAPPLLHSDFDERAFTVGISEPVGTGFTLLPENETKQRSIKIVLENLWKISRQSNTFQLINKTDIAQAVGADMAAMERDALRMRDGGPFVFAQVKHRIGVEEIANHVLQSWEAATGKKRH